MAECEILYRGKRTENGEWIYGLPHYNLDDKIEFIIVPGKIYPNCFKVEVDTIGQFTGVPDMNKKPIFEGDIVVDRTMVFRVIGQIIYNTDKAAFVFKNSVTEESLAKHRWLEIIGNIYDNSELLKEEETSW